jgi:hypothetical protein
MYAGWWDPQNHTAALGIYVKLHHANGYISSYGHMSSIAVQACGTNGCSNLPHGEMLGISGTTGNSTGPHLHFQLTSPTGVTVDPYGWTGAAQDPWPYNQPESLWVMYPLLVSYGPQALPSGTVALAYPSPPGAGIVVDDSSTRFSQEPAECWTDIAVGPGQAQNGNLSYVKPRVGAPNCTGRWAFPQGSTAGQYAVYAWSSTRLSFRTASTPPMDGCMLDGTALTESCRRAWNLAMELTTTRRPSQTWNWARMRSSLCIWE